MNENLPEKKTKSYHTEPLPAIMYSDSIYEACVFEDLFQDGFLDRHHREIDIDEDEIAALVIERLDGLESVIVLTEAMVINGVKAAPFGTIEQDENGRTVVKLGCTEVLPPAFRIEPDYEPAKIQLDWAFAREKNPNIEFPYVPIAQPVIPHVAKQSPASTDELDDIMVKSEGLIFAPSYPFMESHTDKEFVRKDVEHPLLMDQEMTQRVRTKKFVFSSRSNYVWHWSKLYRVMALEFNPMHPMAYPYIVFYEDKGSVIKGRYRWGRTEREFYFNRKSVKYRVHYEVWGSLFGYRNHYLAMFDMVANFDFRELRLFGKPERIYSFSPKYVVEGYFPVKEEDYYSNMYLPRRSQRKGEDQIYTYYSHIPVLIESKGESYSDVTPSYELKYYNMSKWELFVVDRNTGKTVVTLIYSEKRSFQRQEDDRIFVQYSMKSSTMRVFVKTDTITDEESRTVLGTEFLCWCPGCYFFGVPRNTKGSLIPNPSLRSFHDHMQILRANKTTDLLREIMPVRTGEYAVEDSLTMAQIDMIRGEMESEYPDVQEDNYVLRNTTATDYDIRSAFTMNG